MSLVIVGAGPNLGRAVAGRFGREGFAVGLISRTESRLVELAAQLQLDGITTAGAAADIRDSEALANASIGLPSSSARLRFWSIRRYPRPNS
jgi:short-subunit dehydrogenase